MKVEFSGSRAEVIDFWERACLIDFCLRRVFPGYDCHFSDGGDGASTVVMEGVSPVIVGKIASVILPNEVGDGIPLREPASSVEGWLSAQ